MLDSVEVSVMSNFGQLGAFSVLTANALPAVRTGLSLLNVGRYLFVIGGSPDGDNPAATDSVLRAKILGADEAPVLKTLTSAGVGSPLAAGTWYYTRSPRS